MLVMIMLIAAAMLASGTDGVIEVIEYEKGRDQFIHINWSKIPNAADLNWYRVFRSVDDKEFDTISTMDLEKGDKVTVLNVYPGTKTLSGGVASFYDKNKVKINGLDHRSAGLKVYMEGGYVDNTSSPYIQPAGELVIEGRGVQLISITPILYDTFALNASVIKNYDVVMFGSWDNFIDNCKAKPTAAIIKVLEDYLDLGFGILIGHDGFSSMVKSTEGFNPLAKRLNIKIGSMTAGNNEIAGWFEFYSKYVKVAQEGRLTKYPHDLGSVGRLMKIPEAHTGSQWAHENMWFEFAENPADVVDGATKIKPTGKTLKDGQDMEPTGNCVFYLTTKGNLAFIQTGHSSGQSSEDERMILANTLFYLKQKGSNTYVNDFDVYDNAIPENPTLIGGVTIKPDRAEINIKAKDRGTKYIYFIKGYNPVMKESYTSENITTIVTAGIEGFNYLINENSVCNDVSLLKTRINATEVITGTKVLQTNKLILDQTKEGQATINVPFNAGKTYYVHIASVDRKDHMSGITTFQVTFPANPPPPQTPAQTPAQTPSQSPAQTPAQTPSQSPAQTPAQTSVHTPAPTSTKAPIQMPTSAQTTMQTQQQPTEETVHTKDDTNGGGDNNLNKENNDKKGMNKSTVVGIIVGIVGAAAAAAGVIAAVALCRPPIAIVPVIGKEEEEEEEEVFEIPANILFAEEQMEPNLYESDGAEVDAYENDV